MSERYQHLKIDSINNIINNYSLSRIFAFNRKSRFRSVLQICQEFGLFIASNMLDYSLDRLLFFHYSIKIHYHYNRSVFILIVGVARIFSMMKAFL
jgi:putative flippase GtrA